MKRLVFIFLSLILVSCSNNDDDSVRSSNLLSIYIESKNIETGAVIACSASEENTNTILTFFYPEANATNFKLYATQNSDSDKLEYSEYVNINIESDAVFNGYLRRFKTESINEHWIIVTYQIDEEIKLSNPIRIKHITKPTVWNAAVTINQDLDLMPSFSWVDNAFGDNEIYFQVVSKANNDLISGTYTYQNNFKFYDTSNVVLNITEGNPELETNSNYNFTLMDVSIDNWVNLVTQKSFSTP